MKRIKYRRILQEQYSRFFVWSILLNMMLLWASFDSINAQGNLSVGTNLGHFTDWNNVFATKNIMLTARRWHTSPDGNWPHNTGPDYTIPMDDNFYPLQVPYGNGNTPITLLLHEVKEEAYLF